MLINLTLAIIKVKYTEANEEKSKNEENTNLTNVEESETESNSFNLYFLMQKQVLSLLWAFVKKNIKIIKFLINRVGLYGVYNTGGVENPPYAAVVAVFNIYTKNIIFFFGPHNSNAYILNKHFLFTLFPFFKNFKNLTLF